MLEQNPAFQDLAAPVLDNLLFQWCVDPLDVLQKWTAGDPLRNETHLVRGSKTTHFATKPESELRMCISQCQAMHIRCVACPCLYVYKYM